MLATGVPGVSVWLKPRPRLWRALSHMLTCLALAFLGHTAAQASSDIPVRGIPLFGASESHKGSNKALSKWGGALDRYEKALNDLANACDPDRSGICGLRDWQAFVTGLGGKPRRQQLEDVNRYVNDVPYVADDSNYGMTDYWASPDELFARGGDCEDYAITKFLSLRQLGFDGEDMRIVVLRDEAIGIPHAVLVVLVDGEAWLLDNRLRDVVRADQIKSYKPIYSIDGEHWILYKDRS